LKEIKERCSLTTQKFISDAIHTVHWFLKIRDKRVERDKREMLAYNKIYLRCNSHDTLLRIRYEKEMVCYLHLELSPATFSLLSFLSFSSFIS